MSSVLIKDWEQAGQYIQVGPAEHCVFAASLGRADASAENTLLLLHGFPESSFSYHKVTAGLLQQFERVVVFDFVGFGFSDKPQSGFSYSLVEQADVALSIWRQLGVSGGHVLAHDMGDSVLTELAARDVSGLLPAWFADGFISYTFTNGSMVLDLASLRVTQRLLLTRWGPLLSRFNRAKLFYQQARSAQGNSGLSEADLEAMWQQLCLQGGQHKSHFLVQYLKDRKRYEKTRWLPALRELKRPIHLCWGDADAVARVAMAHYLKEQICPRATLTLMPGAGHFCQLSEPELWLASVLTFYTSRHGQS